VNAIKRLRLSLSLTQSQFAGALNIGLASVQNYEAGKRPSRSAIALMNALAKKHKLPLLLADQMETGTLHKAAEDRSVRLHAALDQIINSGRVDQITTIESVLRLLVRDGRGEKA
jgi:transcriptional regulator with XRE-family HTH domain